MQFKYDNNKVEIVCRFVYLGIVFISTGSYTEMQKTAGQTHKKAS